MRTVAEVSKMTGVSVRTLHHYDAVDLLKPAKVTEAGYRLYDDAALQRLQNILMFRELQFSLKEIKEILDSPSFDSKEALAQQIKLLRMRREHLDHLISFACEIQRKGVDKMNFQVFEKKEMKQYEEEVKQRWGTSNAYKEFQQKTKGKSEAELCAISDKLMALFAEIGLLRELNPADKQVQEKVKELQAFITENYYNCTNDILFGLSRMYVEDERMKCNIDKAGGEGTAEFVEQAVQSCCGAST